MRLFRRRPKTKPTASDWNRMLEDAIPKMMAEPSHELLSQYEPSGLILPPCGAVHSCEKCSTPGPMPAILRPSIVGCLKFRSAGHGIRLPVAEEHIERRCPCGHRWAEATADATPTTKETP